jgi:hypothetical protein
VASAWTTAVTVEPGGQVPWGVANRELGCTSLNLFADRVVAVPLLLLLALDGGSLVQLVAHHLHIKKIVSITIKERYRRRKREE